MVTIKKDKVICIILILLIGLFNFHFPHFLIEKHTYNTASYILEFALLLNVIGAIISAIGIYSNKRWGFLLGIIISSVSVILWIAQETIGLPGLPKMWFEPSRIVSLLLETFFVFIAFKQLKQKTQRKTEK